MNDKRQGVLLEWMLDKIEKNGRVDGSSFFCVFECEVQVGTSTATTVACQRDDDAGTDVGAFGDESLGEVAIADGEVAVTEGDIEAVAERAGDRDMTEWTDKCRVAVGLLRLGL